MAEIKKKEQTEPVVIEIANEKPTGSFGGATKEEREAE
jgi:hypothetical protein